MYVCTMLGLALLVDGSIVESMQKCDPTSRYVRYTCIHLPVLNISSLGSEKPSCHYYGNHAVLTRMCSSGV